MGLVFIYTWTIFTNTYLLYYFQILESFCTTKIVSRGDTKFYILNDYIPFLLSGAIHVLHVSSSIHEHRHRSR